MPRHTPAGCTLQPERGWGTESVPGLGSACVYRREHVELHRGFDGVVFHQAQVKINAKHPCFSRELSTAWLAVCSGSLWCSFRFCPLSHHSSAKQVDLGR